MRCFCPTLEPANESDKAIFPREKFRGDPEGLRAEEIPVCKFCGHQMSLICQLAHSDDRLNLGKEGRVLFIFQCDEVNDGFAICPTWDPESGANACFVIEADDLAGQSHKLPDRDVPQEREFIVAGWSESVDDVSEDEAAYMLDLEKFNSLSIFELNKILDKVESRSKLGGIPHWIQHLEIPTGNWRIVGQLDDSTGVNFGDGGIGYIFLEDVGNSTALPKGKFLWQCS